MSGTDKHALQASEMSEAKQLVLAKMLQQDDLTVMMPQLWLSLYLGHGSML